MQALESECLWSCFSDFLSFWLLYKHIIKIQMHEKKNSHSENISPNCVGHKNGACNSERRNTCFAILDVISSREKNLVFSQLCRFAWSSLGNDGTHGIYLKICIFSNKTFSFPQMIVKVANVYLLVVSFSWYVSHFVVVFCQSFLICMSPLID